MEKRTFELVISIDFGTTGSGYAFQSRADFLSDRLKIYENLQWGREILQYKTPTCLLVSPDQKTTCFGDEAEQEYTKLRPSDNPKRWFFFRNFKMQLYGKEDINSKFMLTSEQGSELPAVFVFAESIKWMRKHVLDFLEMKKCRYLEQSTRWVLTVPAIWTEAAKQLMRKAAQQAGILQDNLCIALEPEVAAVYCTTVEANPNSDPQRDLDMSLKIGPGTTNMIVDIGGGTVDITVIEVKPDGKMRQIHSSEGGPVGGQKVDEKFYRFMSDFLGTNLWRKFMERPIDFCDFRMQLEKAKRNLPVKLRHSGARDEFFLPVPGEILEEFARASKTDIAVALRNNPLTKDNVDFEYGRLVFKGKILRDIMNESLEEILGFITRVAQETRQYGQRIHSVILVGGFASSNFLTKELKEKVQTNLRLIIKRPEHCELAVLRGAVLYGHDESILTSRVVRMTYGLGVTMPYSARYPIDRKFELGGNTYVSGVFVPHVSRGQEVKIDEWISVNEYYPLEKDQKDVLIYIFASPQKNVKMTDEAQCECIGHFKIEFGQGASFNQASTEIAFNFGRTELIVRARDTATGNEVYHNICLKETI